VRLAGVPARRQQSRVIAGVQPVREVVSVVALGCELDDPHVRAAAFEVLADPRGGFAPRPIGIHHHGHHSAGERAGPLGSPRLRPRNGERR